MTPARSLVAVTMIGVAIGALLAFRNLAPVGFDPSVTIRFGEAFPAQIEYAEDLLGSIVVSPLAGHDGKFFFSQALDPFYSEPDVHATYLDRPAYRAQRMLYPTLAGGFGLLSPTATAWGLIVLNVIGLGLGTWATARVAMEMGISPWFGLAFAFNIGMLVELNIDGSGILALAATMLAVLAVMRKTTGLAVVALVAACLARETMLLAAAGLALYVWRTERRIPWRFAAVPAAVGLWWVYVHARLEDGLAQDTKALDLPFRGLLEAAGGWRERAGGELDLLIAVILMWVALALTVRALRSPTALGWSALGFSLLAPLLSEPVWRRYFDSTRALAPLLTAYLLMIPAQMKAQKMAGDAGDGLPLEPPNTRSHRT